MTVSYLGVAAWLSKFLGWLDRLPAGQQQLVVGLLLIAIGAIGSIVWAGGKRAIAWVQSKQGIAHLVATSGLKLDVQHHVVAQRAELAVWNRGREASWTVSARIIAADGWEFSSLPFTLEWVETGDTHLPLKTNAFGMIVLAKSDANLRYKNRRLEINQMGTWGWHKEKNAEPDIVIELTFMTDVVGDPHIPVRYRIRDTIKNGVQIERLKD
jgi:hypothetical protein